MCFCGARDSQLEVVVPVFDADNEKRTSICVENLDILALCGFAKCADLCNANKN